mgnify:CR=1 FL=1
MIHPTASQHLGQVRRRTGQGSHQGLDVGQFHPRLIVILDQDESEDIKKQLEEAGAVVELA